MKLTIALATLVAIAAPVAAFDSGDIEPGASWSMTFNEVNEEGYHYHCHPHPWMVGMVHVVPDTDGGTTTHVVEILEPAKSEDWGYSVEHLEIEVGDTVTWKNTGAVVHTVTKMADGHGHDDHSDHHHDDTEHPDDREVTQPGFGLIAGVFGIGLIAFLRRHD